MDNVDGLMGHNSIEWDGVNVKTGVYLVALLTPNQIDYIHVIKY